jgi:hypothetical protein
MRPAERERLTNTTALRRGIRLVIGMLALCLAGGSWAQESLDLGKSPARLFASDCSGCHKSPQGLGKAGGLAGLDSFLREHYTASRETAAAIASYLKTMNTGPAAPGRASKRTAKGDDKAKSDDKKKSGAKPGDAKGSEKKPVDATSDSPDAKSPEPKPAEILAPEPKSVESKSSAPAADARKPAEGAKSEKSE